MYRLHYPLLLSILLIVSLGTPSLSAVGNYRLAEDKHLSIYAKRSEDIIFFENLIPRIERETKKYLPSRPPESHLLIRLTYHENSRNKKYLVRIKSPRESIIDISWGAHTELEDLIHAYIELQITHWWFFNKIENGEIPSWLLDGITQNIMITMSYTSWHRQPDDRIASRFTPLSNLFSGDKNLIASTFLLRWLKASFDTPVKLKTFMSAILKGNDPMISLYRQLPNPPEKLEELELSWRLGFYQQLEFRDTAYWSLEESLDRIKALNEWIITIDDQVQNLTLDQLLELKNDPQVQSLAKQRIALTKLYLNKINPVYYNTLWAFGRALEELLAKESQFTEAITRLTQDAESAILLHQETRKLLPLAPLP